MVLTGIMTTMESEMLTRYKTDTLSYHRKIPVMMATMPMKRHSTNVARFSQAFNWYSHDLKSICNKNLVDKYTGFRPVSPQLDAMAHLRPREVKRAGQGIHLKVQISSGGREGGGCTYE